MIEHIILTNLQVEVCIGDASFYGQQVDAVTAEVEFLHDMRRPHRVKLPDGVKLRCAMPKDDPVMVELPPDYDITDSVDMDRIAKLVLLARISKEQNELDAGLARRPSLEKENG